MKTGTSQHLSNREFNLPRALKRARELGLNRQPRFALVAHHLNANPDDVDLREILQEELEAAENLELIESDSFRANAPLNTGEFTGSVLLGVIKPHDVPYCIPPAQLLTHCLCVGMTGGGKSNVILLILCQLLKARQA